MQKVSILISFAVLWFFWFMSLSFFCGNFHHTKANMLGCALLLLLSLSCSGFFFCSPLFFYEGWQREYREKCKCWRNSNRQSYCPGQGFLLEVQGPLKKRQLNIGMPRIMSQWAGNSSWLLLARAVGHNLSQS